MRKGTLNLIMILAVVLVVVIIACIIGIVVSPVSEPVPTEPSESTAALLTEAAENAEATTVATDEAAEATAEATEESATAPTNPPATVPATNTKPTDPPKTVISLPYTIPGTTLVIQRVANYDGIYLEDGTNSEVSGVAMMLLYNSGSEAVEYANCTLVYDDKTLQFVASAIPAGARVAVQEATKASCASGDLTSCSADIALMEAMDMSDDLVKVEDNGNNSLIVTNLTDQDIVTVRVFYKYYLTDESAYVGGITYNAKISGLKAGESIVITPSHFSSEGSVVVMVRTYDTDE